MAAIVESRQNRYRRLELCLYGAVVAFALIELTWSAYSTSRAFDPGSKHAGVHSVWGGACQDLPC